MITVPAQVLARHERVAEVAVIGVPDERLGEVARAFVVPRPGPALTAEELAAYGKERLADYKLPRSYRFVEALPRNASGNVLKTILRETAWPATPTRPSRTPAPTIHSGPSPRSRRPSRPAPLTR